MDATTTLLDRCCSAYAERLERTGPFDEPLPLCMAHVFEHLAAEITLMASRTPGFTLNTLAELLLQDAATVEPTPIRASSTRG